MHNWFDNISYAPSLIRNVLPQIQVDDHMVVVDLQKLSTIPPLVRKLRTTLDLFSRARPTGGVYLWVAMRPLLPCESLKACYWLSGAYGPPTFVLH